MPNGLPVRSRPLAALGTGRVGIGPHPGHLSVILWPVNKPVSCLSTCFYDTAQAKALFHVLAPRVLAAPQPPPRAGRHHHLCLKDEETGRGGAGVLLIHHGVTLGRIKPRHPMLSAWPPATSDHVAVEFSSASTPGVPWLWQRDRSSPAYCARKGCADSLLVLKSSDALCTFHQNPKSYKTLSLVDNTCAQYAWVKYMDICHLP